MDNNNNTLHHGLFFLLHTPSSASLPIPLIATLVAMKKMQNQINSIVLISIISRYYHNV
jgi:hypothetical protein